LKQLKQPTGVSKEGCVSKCAPPMVGANTLGFMCEKMCERFTYRPDGPEYDENLQQQKSQCAFVTGKAKRVTCELFKTLNCVTEGDNGVNGGGEKLLGETRGNGGATNGKTNGKSSECSTRKNTECVEVCDTKWTMWTGGEIKLHFYSHMIAKVLTTVIQVLAMVCVMWKGSVK
jgi:hypothetical protein